uniref:Uncharacterized protein SPEM3-like n=1 Tax=Petromyzon marinus TaxID=7757 RepID=A0AAJ7XID6_PETMA|nr:uncharacterized protein SPEM3-like [Petromyzon marinus]
MAVSSVGGQPPPLGSHNSPEQAAAVVHFGSRLMESRGEEAMGLDRRASMDSPECSPTRSPTFSPGDSPTRAAHDEAEGLNRHSSTRSPLHSLHDEHEQLNERSPTYSPEYSPTHSLDCSTPHLPKRSLTHSSHNEAGGLNERSPEHWHASSPEPRSEHSCTHSPAHSLAPRSPAHDSDPSPERLRALSHTEDSHSPGLSPQRLFALPDSPSSPLCFPSLSVSSLCCGPRVSPGLPVSPCSLLVSPLPGVSPFVSSPAIPLTPRISSGHSLSPCLSPTSHVSPDLSMSRCVSPASQTSPNLAASRSLSPGVPASPSVPPRVAASPRVSRVSSRRHHQQQQQQQPPPASAAAMLSGGLHRMPAIVNLLLVLLKRRGEEMGPWAAALRERKRHRVAQRRLAWALSRLRETRQALDVAVEMERRREVVVRQLDETLAQVVRCCKRRDAHLTEQSPTVQAEKAAERSHDTETERASDVAAAAVATS